MSSMTTPTMLREKDAGYRQGTRAVVPEGKGAEIEVRLMGWEPGADVVEGSSGDYPVAAIARDFKDAFPVGTRMRANHDGFCDAGGNIERVMAKTTTLPVKREDGMYAKARVREGEATDFLRQFADVIGTSVSVGVELEKIAATDDSGEPILDYEDKPVMVNKTSERGAPIVKRFLSMMESPYNSVDFVEAPGADGAVVSIAIEAAKSVYEHTTLREAATFSIDLAGEREPLAPEVSEATPPRTSKEKKMEKEERDALVEAMRESLVPAIAEALKPAASTSEQPTLGATVEAVVTAGLTEEGRKAVYKAVDRGESLESAVETETSREAGIQAEVDKRVAEALESKKGSDALTFGYETDDQHGELADEKSATGNLSASERAEFDAITAGGK